MAELGNDAFTTRRERKLAEKKTVAKSARSLSTALRSRGTELVVASQELVSEKIAPAVVARPRETSRIRWARALVMTVALALVGTTALPAYAIDHSASAVNVEDYQALLAQAATLTVSDAATSSTASRDGVTIGVAAPVQTFQDVAPRDAVNVSGIQANSALLNSALSLIGMSGDCTMLVEAALRKIGFQVGDEGPMGFGKFGTVFYDPAQVQPGDIMMRGGHVAIYAGNGLAVHGGIGYQSYLMATESQPSRYVAFVRVR